MTLAIVEILHFLRRDTDRTVREEFRNGTAVMAFSNCAESLPLSRHEGAGLDRGGLGSTQLESRPTYISAQS